MDAESTTTPNWEQKYWVDVSSLSINYLVMLHSNKSI